MHRIRHSTLSTPRRLTRLALCLSLSLAITSCRPFFQREVAGAVLSVEGAAQATVGTATSRLTTEARIHPGEKISTAPDGRVDLMLLPGMLVELAANTEIQVQQLRFTKDGDESIHPMTARDARIRLLRGTLFGVIRQTQTRSGLFIETAAGTLAAGSGRTFKIEVTGNKVWLMSIRGRLSFEPVPGSQRQKIGPGFFLEWPGDAAPRAASESGREAQAEVPRILRVEQRLLRRSKETHAPYLPWHQ